MPLDFATRFLHLQLLLRANTSTLVPGSRVLLSQHCQETLLQSSSIYSCRRAASSVRLALGAWGTESVFAQLFASCLEAVETCI